MKKLLFPFFLFASVAQAQVTQAGAPGSIGGSLSPSGGGTGGSGTVTSVSVTTANGVSGTVATPTVTPAITLTLGAITPTSVNGLTITSSTGTLTIANSKTLTANNSLTFAGTDGTTETFPATSDTVAGLATSNTFTGSNTLSINQTVFSGAYSFGALPSGATTAGTQETHAATTFTVTGTNTATAFQEIYHGVPTFTDASVGTVTDLFSEIWVGPAAVAGSLLGTRVHTLGIVDPTSPTTSTAGAVVIATTLGTAATSIGMGNGAINAGGAITSGGSVTGTSVNGTISNTGNVVGVKASNSSNGAGAGIFVQASNGTHSINMDQTSTANTAHVVTNDPGSNNMAALYTDTGVIVIGAGGTLSDTIGLTGGILGTGQGGIGYGPAALATGGSVTQITSRSTAIGSGFNFITGQITGNNTSLAALGFATFTVTDTSVAIHDVVTLSVQSGNSTTLYWVSAVAAGSFSITEYNASTGTADTTVPILNIAVIKGQSS